MSKVLSDKEVGGRNTQAEGRNRKEENSCEGKVQQTSKQLAAVRAEKGKKKKKQLLIFST